MIMIMIEVAGSSENSIFQHSEVRISIILYSFMFRNLEPCTLVETDVSDDPTPSIGVAR